MSAVRTAAQRRLQVQFVVALVGVLAVVGLGVADLVGGVAAVVYAALVAGLLLAVAVIIVAWIAVGIEYAVPLIILAGLCTVGLVGFRLISSRNRDPAASEEGGLPAQAPDPTRPLGDTAEAHDEVNPHDFPLYNPGRRTAERMASGPANTTRGMKNGAAAGAGGSREGETEAVGDDEAGGASTDSAFGPDRD